MMKGDSPCPEEGGDQEGIMQGGLRTAPISKESPLFSLFFLLVLSSI